MTSYVRRGVVGQSAENFMNKVECYEQADERGKNSNLSGEVGGKSKTMSRGRGLSFHSLSGGGWGLKKIAYQPPCRINFGTALNYNNDISK